MSKLVLIWLFVVFAQGYSLIDRENDVDPKNNFALIKNMTLIIGKQDETLQLPLESMYRGQLLTFQSDLRFMNGTRVTKNLVKVTSPLQLMRTSKIIQESETSGELYALPQTSLIFRDRLQNVYLMYIDSKMFLRVHNLTDYYQYYAKKPVNDLVLSIDIYSAFGGEASFDPERSCNNIMQVNETIFMCICKSSTFGLHSKKIATSIFISISDLVLRQYTLSQKVTGFFYDDYRDGTMIMFKKDPGDPQDKFFYLVKENATSCNIRMQMQQADVSTSYFESVLNIKEFLDPLVNGTGKQQDDEEQQSKNGCNSPGPVVFDAPRIPYLRIRDIKMVPYYEDVLVASDFMHGLLFWKIEKILCEKEGFQDEKVIDCFVEKPLYRIRFERLGSITLLPAENPSGERTLFVTQLYPARVIEIQLNDQERPPSVLRIYSLVPFSQTSEYHSLDLLDVNQDFILTYIVNIKTMVPLIRIYRRKTGLFSSVYTDLPLPSDFVDSGLFFRFFTLTQNFFILKTSQEFMVYSIEPKYLTIQLQGESPQSISGLRGVKELPLNLTLHVKNQTKHSLVNSFNVLILSEDNQQSQTLIPPNTEIDIMHVCGENTIIGGDQIDKYFSGQYPLLQIEQQESRYFALQKCYAKYQKSIYPEANSCHYTIIVRFTRQSLNQKDRWYLACIPKAQSIVTFRPLISSPAPELDMAQFLMPISQGAKILGKYFEMGTNQLFILTLEEGKIRFHVFSLFNIMTWEATSNLSEEITELKGLVVRDYDSMYFNPILRQGLIITESSANNQKIIVFEVDGNSIFKLRAILNLTNVVVDARIDDGGFIWLLQADQKIIIYQQVNPVQIQEGQSKYKDLVFVKQYLSIALSKFFKPTLLLTFEICPANQILIFFSDSRTITIFKYDTNSIDIFKAMELQPTYTSDTDTDLIRLEFLVNTKTGKPLSVLLDSQLFVIFKVYYQATTLIDYQLHIWDIREPLHNAQVLKQNLMAEKDDLKFNETQASLQVVRLREYPEEVYAVLIGMSEGEQVVYEFNPKSAVIVDRGKADKFLMECKDEERVFNFSLYPSDNPTARLNFHVKPKNRGLIVTKKNPKEEVTVEVISKAKLASHPQPKKVHYNLLKNIEGYNLNFSVSCKLNQSEGYGNQICEDLQLYQQYQVYEDQVEFLSFRNRALGFFVIDSMHLIINSDMVTVYNVEAKDYFKLDIEEVFSYLRPSLENPALFGRKLVIEDFELFDLEYEGGFKAKYLMSVNSFNQVSISKVLSLKSELTAEEVQKDYPTYAVLRDPGSSEKYLLIQKASVSVPVYSKIMISKAFTFTPAVRDAFSVVFVYDEPKQMDASSRIEVYNFDLRDPDPNQVKIGRNLTFKSIYSDRIGINLKVSSLAILQEHRIMVVGLRGIGLMFYHIEQMKLLKIETLTNSFIFGSTNPSVLDIIEICPQSERNFKLLTLRRGVIVLTYPELTAQMAKSFGQYDLEPSLYEEASQKYLQNDLIQSLDSKAMRRQVVTSTNGLVFGTVRRLSEEEDRLALDLNFYSFSVSNRSRSLATYELSRDDQSCTHLQRLAYPAFLHPHFSSPATPTTEYFALLCHSTLKFIAFDFTPTLTLTLQEDTPHTHSTLEISASNSLHSTETFVLHVSFLNQERALDSYWYVGVLVGLSLIMLGIHLGMKRQVEKVTKKVEKKEAEKAQESMMVSQNADGNDALRQLEAVGAVSYTKKDWQVVGKANRSYQPKMRPNMEDLVIGTRYKDMKTGRAVSQIILEELPSMAKDDEMTESSDDDF